MLEPYKVYVKTDERGRITAINSDAFLSSLDGWQEIDSGSSDKYHHAQGNYFDKPIRDERGICRYKFVNGRPVERTKEEMDADWVEPEVKPTPEQRLAALEEQLAAAKILLGVE